MHSNMAAVPRVLRITSRALFRRSSTLCASVNAIAFSQKSIVLAQKYVSLKCSVVPAQIRWYSSESAMTEADLTTRVVNVVKMFDKVTPDKVIAEAHFVKDLGLDSLDAVEIVMAFEDEFGVEISDEEAEKILSCQDAINLLKVKMDIPSSS